MKSDAIKNPEIASLSPSPAGASAVVTMAEWRELHAWRKLGDRLELLVARVLASQGEAPEREHIDLQHALAELLRPLEPQQSTQKAL